MSPNAIGSDSVAFLKLRGLNFLRRYRAFLLSGTAAVGCVFLLRSLSFLQLLELAAYDRLLQLRPAEPADDRIILVAFSEKDLQSIGKSQIPDQVVVNLLNRIKEQKPRVIGLDMFRNLSTPPGYEALINVFETTPNLIGIAKVIGNGNQEEVSGNPVLVDRDRIAASDVVIDVDGRVRRALLFPSAEQPIEGLGLRLAQEYLAAQNITADSNAPTLRFGQAELTPFSANDGGYVNADAGGYQMLLNPRVNRNMFRLIAAADVLSGKVPPQALRDRLVIVGSTASDSDLFFTSYSSVAGTSPVAMSGLELHANIASQIISAVLDRRPLLRSLPKWLEWGFIIGLGYGSAWISAQRLSNFSKLALGLLLLGGVTLASYTAILFGWWVPMVPIVCAIVIAGAVMMMVQTQELTLLSSQDGLTLLSNRRTFDEMLEREWYRALRSQTPLGLVLCDVDYFKIYNDTYGHAKGDDCLRRVGGALKKAVKRPMDLAARYGGEEFVVLLPNTDSYGTLKVAKQIQAEIESLQLEHRGSKVAPTVTLSLGAVSLVPAVGLAPTRLVEIADMGLYEAKQRGRNQVILKIS
jgi:diguanylate cyclase (GGDEF)-like protein